MHASRCPCRLRRTSDAGATCRCTDASKCASAMALSLLLRLVGGPPEDGCCTGAFAAVAAVSAAAAHVQTVLSAAQCRPAGLRVSPVILDCEYRRAPSLQR